MIALIIFLGLITYALSIGIAVAVFKNSKLYSKFINTFDYSQRKELTGFFIVIAPLSCVLIFLAYIGCGTYHLVTMLFYTE